MTAPLRVGEGLPGPGSEPDPHLLPDDVEGWENFDRLLHLQCTLREVAAFFERSEQWVRDRVRLTKGMSFQEYAARVRPKGMVSLRRKQFELALQGDRTMLIWLGKQYLGQADKAENVVSGPDGGPVQIEANVADPARLVLEGLAQIAARQQVALEAAREVHGNHPLRIIAGATDDEPHAAADDA